MHEFFAEQIEKIMVVTGFYDIVNNGDLTIAEVELATEATKQNLYKILGNVASATALDSSLMDSIFKETVSH